MAGALILALTLCAAASPPSQGAPSRTGERRPEPRRAPPPVWPDLRVLDAVDDPQITYAGGTPVMVRAVRVKEKPGQLIQLFVDTFRARGLWVPPGRDQPQPSSLPTLTAFDPRRQVSYSVIFQPNADGTTTLLLGEAHLAQAERARGSQVAPLPVFPGGTTPVVLAQEGSTLLSYDVTAQDAEVRAFYRQTLLPEGFREDEATPGLFVGAYAEVLVSSQPSAGRRSVIVLVRPRAGAGP